ncbi:hypothetical protein ABT095_34140 [Kitasatospora sp. NPDC002227]|uniref:hypothetical protein n=1 Tax=Kitasatospora sp. NPDC002227 TaxID=3154773 RepID=UPI00331860A3
MTPVQQQAVVPAQRQPSAPATRRLLGRTTGRLRESTRTAPGRLRLAGAVLTGLLLLLGAATCWQAVGLGRATDQVVSHSEPLSENAAEIYRSLADADTTAAGNFLLAGNAPAAVHQRYQDDLAKAGRLLTEAAARTDTSSAAQGSIAKLNQQLPVYSALVATAGTYDRQGLPLGGAYLRHASELMRTTMLPTAQQLVDDERKRLDADYEDALGLPYLAAGLGVLTLAALVWCQVLLLRRTNRVFNIGMLGATAAVVLTLGWLATAGAAAQSGLGDSRDHAARPLRALDQARFSALQARAAENLDLVARGATTQYTTDWAADTKALSGGQLDQARQGAPEGSVQALTAARTAFQNWTAKHQAAATANDAGDYDTALKAVIGPGSDSSDAAFAALDQHLADAATVEQAAFRSAARGVGGWWTALAGGAVVLAALGAAGVVVGLGRRLAEYR